MYYVVSNILDFFALLKTTVFNGCDELNISFESTKVETIFLGESINTLGEGVFKDCTSINDAIIECNIDAIPDEMFNNCNNLTAVFFKDNSSIKTIGKSAFSNCNSIASIELPPDIVTISANAFSSCHILENIVLPHTISNIDDTSFSGCAKLETGNAVIFTSNQIVKDYFFKSFSLANIVSINLSIYEMYYNKILALFNNDKNQTNTHFFPALKVTLPVYNQADLPQLIGDDINIDIVPEFRNLVLQYIFAANPDYNDFVINNTTLKVNPLNSNISYPIKVYNTSTRNIDTFYDIISDKSAIYGLLDNQYTEFIINGITLRISSSQYVNTYNLIYSTNNFVSSTQLLTNSNSDTSTNITNYNIITGKFNDFFITKVPFLNGINAHIEACTLSIGCKKADLDGKTTINPDSYDAQAFLDVPVSTINKTFLFSSVNTDMCDDNSLKFKVVYDKGWENIDLSQAKTTAVYGGIPYNNPKSSMCKNNLKYDFVRFIAKEIFNTAAGVDLFKNNNEVTAGIKNDVKDALTNKLKYLETKDWLNNEEYLQSDGTTDDNVSRTIFMHILKKQAIRFTDNYPFGPMFYAGDTLSIKLSITPHEDQHTLLNRTTPLSSRTYLIVLKLKNIV